jgi:hypothetical protein
MLPPVNYLAILACAAVIFALGGLWYSVLFTRRWTALMGIGEAQMKAGASSAMPVLFVFAFICATLVAWTLAIILNHFEDLTPLRGAMVGALCWLGFAGATSFTTAQFSMQPVQLWLINSGYNLVSFVVAGIILAVWR